MSFDEVLTEKRRKRLALLIQLAEMGQQSEQSQHLESFPNANFIGQ